MPLQLYFTKVGTSLQRVPLIHEGPEGGAHDQNTI